MQRSETVVSKCPDLATTTSKLLHPQPRTLPPFLQRHLGSAAAAVTVENADAAAEASASSPGPLGDGLAPEDWFDGLLVGYLADRWQEHAAAMDQGVTAVVSVCTSQGVTIHASSPYHTVTPLPFQTLYFCRCSASTKSIHRHTELCTLTSPVKNNNSKSNSNNR
jgi:hypothetical protein